MAGMEMKIEADNTQQIADIVRAQTRVALEAVGLQAEGYAKRLCPVDTGNLRNSITHTSDDDTAYIGTNVEYAPYVHDGTMRMSPNPFIKNAMEKNKNQYKKMIEETIKPKEVRIIDVYPASGINVGPGLMAAYYMGKPISKDLSEEKELINRLLNAAE